MSEAIGLACLGLEPHSADGRKTRDPGRHRLDLDRQRASRSGDLVVVPTQGSGFTAIDAQRFDRFCVSNSRKHDPLGKNKLTGRSARGRLNAIRASTGNDQHRETNKQQTTQEKNRHTQSLKGGQQIFKAQVR